MTILGYNVRAINTNGSSRAPGRLYVSKYTLAVAGTLTELHCLCSTTTAASAGTARLVVYAADGSGGNPGTRLYYSGLLVTPATVGEFELAVTGLNVPLPAGDYWLGWVDITMTTNGTVYGDTSGLFFGWSSGASDPPPNPFGAGDVSGARRHSIWGVVGSPVNPSGFTQKVKFGSGLGVTDEGSGVVRVDAAAGAWIQISKTDLASPGSFDLTSIPQIYTDLMMVVTARGVDSSFSDTLRVILNGATSGYYQQRMVASAAAVTASESIGSNKFQLVRIPAASSPANMFGVSVWQFMGYSSTVWMKNMLADESGPINTGTGAIYLGKHTGVWASTAAINRLTVLGDQSANLVAGSQLRLYGRT